VDGKARMAADKFCDGLGACLGECPTGALQVIEREADEFDETAVEEHLAAGGPQAVTQRPAASGGCPSAAIRMFAPASACQAANAPESLPQTAGESALSHWPVQIRLVPANAPFLKGADLLVVADCVPLAFPSFHQDFLKGRAVTMGCPKFDDTQAYTDKFVDIFNTAGIKSVTTVVMEVPCCAGLPAIVGKALELSGKQIPNERVVISTRGRILRRIRG
jgi:ferredoxin